MKRTKQGPSRSLLLCFVGDYQFAVETSTIERIADRRGVEPGRIVELSSLFGSSSTKGHRLLIVSSASGKHGFAVESISKGDLSSLPIQPVPQCLAGCMDPMILKGFVTVEDLLLQVLDLPKLAEWLDDAPQDRLEGREIP